VAAQVAGLARRTAWQPPLLFDGGPSHSHALRQALGGLLDTEPAVPPCGQFATALGAALLAQEQ
jgi:activator of 2-hydroxyglutaryl-CoA dehydratase